MGALFKFSLPAILFLLTLAFGFWVSRMGRPYPAFLFNIHKLIALGAMITVIFQLSKTPLPADSLALISALLVVAALCTAALFTSGALMSLGKLDYSLMRTVHQIAPAILAIASMVVAYLLE